MSIVSPCVGVCQINVQTKFCLGCWRTLREVAQWSRLSDEQRKAVLDELKKRQSEAGVDRRRKTKRRRHSRYQ